MAARQGARQQIACCLTTPSYTFAEILTASIQNFAKYNFNMMIGSRIEGVGAIYILCADDAVMEMCSICSSSTHKPDERNKD